ncbi:MAG TPA: SBBP repeat-containing protein [Verrucomicrobiae bacterium]|nr:SBBP repeat-containing protein [Verrucomicrobiae bacterium]
MFQNGINAPLLLGPRHGYLKPKRVGISSLAVCLLLCLLCFLGPNAKAQVDTAWSENYDGPALVDDYPNALAVDASGNVYVTGGSNASGSGTDIATIKYDPSGNELWAARYSFSSAVDQGDAVAVDGAGNVYVAGQSVGFGTCSDFVTIKYNSSGDTLWVRRHNSGGANCDLPKGIGLDASGNVYVAGTGGGDFLIIKYDSNGNLLWTRSYNGPGNSLDEAAELAMDGAGNAYVCGWGYNVGSNIDYTTVKYLPNGDTAWVRHYNGTGNSTDQAKAIAVSASGDVYVTGQSIGSGTANDFATIRYNSTGDTVWVRRYHNGNDIGIDLTLDGAGNAYVTGHADAGGFPAYEDFATIKYDAAGNQEWVNLYNSPGNIPHDFPTAIAADPAGNVYVTGRGYVGFPFNAADDYTTLRYSNAGVQQWVVRFNGSGNENDRPSGLAVDAVGNVYVTGGSKIPGNLWDYVTIKYSQNPHLSVTPSSLNFGYVTPGDTAALALTVLNSGAKELNLGSIIGPSAPFSLITDGCSGQSLSPFDTTDDCHLLVRFAPAALGSVLDSIKIPSNDPALPLKTLYLQGIGGGDTILIFSVSPDEVITGDTATLEITGQQFSSGALRALTSDPEVFLVRSESGPGRDTILADTVNLIDSTRLKAFFKFEETDLGWYDLVAERANGERSEYPRGVYLLISLVLPELRSVGFNGFSIGVERFGKLLCENAGSTKGFLLYQLKPPAPGAIEARLMTLTGDTIWSSQRDSADTVRAWVVPLDVAQSYWLADGWKVKPERVIFPKIAPRRLDDDEFVIFGSGQQVTVDGTTGVAKDKLKDLIKEVIIGTACQSVAQYLTDPSNVTLLENVLQNLANQLEQAQQAATPQGILKEVANQLNPLSGWVGIVDAMRSCLETIVGEFMRNWDQKRSNMAASICQLQGNQRLEQMDRILRRNAIGRRAVEDALLNCQSKGVRGYSGAVRGSWDPNDKTSAGAFILAKLPQEDTLRPVYPIPIAGFGDSIQYTILFENKAQATDSAVNVFITDTLDTNLDLSSLRIDSSSLRGNFSYSLNGQVLTAQFANIMLAPNVVPPEGEWFLNYWIKPKPNLPVRTFLRNRASIVFDFNPAIQTGEVVHMLCSGLGDLNGDVNFTPADVVLMLTCVFLGSGDCAHCFTDVNCDGNLSPADIVLELNKVFLDSPLPC